MPWWRDILARLGVGKTAVVPVAQQKQVAPPDQPNLYMAMSDTGYRLTQASEGFRNSAYQDTGGVWTIGYGHTKGVYQNMTCTQPQAQQWLVEDVQEAEGYVKQYVTRTLQQGEFDALVDFTYNEGPGAAAIKDGFVWLVSGRHSTLLLKTCAGDPTASAEFLKWDVGGPPGLFTRHNRQKQLFDTGDWS
jgi:lysozyme